MSAKKDPCKIIEKEIVCEFISTSDKGITVCTLEEKTGYSQKKIQKAVKQLKKEGKIKNYLRGVYTKA